MPTARAGGLRRQARPVGRQSPGKKKAAAVRYRGNGPLSDAELFQFEPPARKSTFLPAFPQMDVCYDPAK
jgi:hypothetical protein